MHGSNWPLAVWPGGFLVRVQLQASDLNLSVFGYSGSWGSWFLVFDLGVMGHGSSGDGWYKKDTRQAAQPIVKFWRVITTSNLESW